MSRYFNRAGETLTLEGWCALGDAGYRIVKQEDVGDYLVSTVWLGLNHNYADGPPLIFETMVFGREDAGKSGDECFCERYSTEAQAVAGHSRVVEGVRDGTLALYGDAA